MNIFYKLIKSPYFFLLILASISLIIAITLVKTPLEGNGDMLSHLEAMNFLQEKPYTEDFMINRVLTSPLMLYSSIFFGYLIDSNKTGMMIVNLIFYFLIILVFYKLVELIYQNRTISLLSSILFFTNYCMFNYGTTYRADIGGWFFFLLSTLFAVKYYQSRLENKKVFFYSILSASIGVLFKEYGALGLISLSLLILFSNIAFWEKIKKIFKAGILFSIIPGLYYLFFYFKFDYSYFNWYFQNFDKYVINPEITGGNYSLILMIKVLGWLFLIGWPIFLWGVYQLWKNYDKQKIIYLTALLPASLVFLAWPSFTQRVAFILVPWLALISGYGLSKIKNRYIIILILLIYASINYLTRPWLLSMINL